MENGYENADTTIITDGEYILPEAFTEEFRKKTDIKSHKNKMLSVPFGGPATLFYLFSYQLLQEHRHIQRTFVNGDATNLAIVIVVVIL